MRVLMVSDVYFPRVNGVSTSIETFRKTLQRMGVEVRRGSFALPAEPCRAIRKTVWLAGAACTTRCWRRRRIAI